MTPALADQQDAHRVVCHLDRLLALGGYRPDLPVPSKLIMPTHQSGEPL